MPAEIQPADPRRRVVTLSVLAVAAVAAAAGVAAFGHWLARAGASLPPAELVVRLRHLIGLTLTAAGLCLLALAAGAARLARRIESERRWPLAGAKPLRNTPVTRGDAAVAIARRFAAAALGLLVLAAAVGVASWRLFDVRG